MVQFYRVLSLYVASGLHLGGADSIDRAIIVRPTHHKRGFYDIWVARPTQFLDDLQVY
jgi:hypothetical protein